MLHDDLMHEKGAPAVAGGVRCLRVRCYAPSDPAPSSLLVCARIGVAAALAVLGDSSEDDLMWACRAKQICMQTRVSLISHLLLRSLDPAPWRGARARASGRFCMHARTKPETLLPNCSRAST